MTSAAEAEMQKRTIEGGDFDWIVLQNQKQIYRTLLFIVRNADAAEVLTQECFLRAFRKRGSFRGESSLATWLMRIAINLAHDHLRNRRLAFWRRLMRTDRIETIQAPAAHRSAEHALINQELVSTVHSAVERLSPKQKMVFQLRFVEEMPLDAIAQVMDLEIGTVKTHLYRAIEAVRSACGKQAI